MKATFEVINGMVADGVLNGYAIGGAVGATFYLEPVSTFDIGVFISFQSAPGSSLVSLTPIYEYLVNRGYKADGEHILVEGWNVQFLPADDLLYNDALRSAVEAQLDGTKVFVMTAEHLMAIALRTGRRKDLMRLEGFMEVRAFDEAKLHEILKRHGLQEKWSRFQSSRGTGG